MRKGLPRAKSRGFTAGLTVVEMAVVSGLIGILAAILITIFVQGRRILDQNRVQTELQLETRSSVDEIVRNIRLANQALSTYSHGGQDYSGASSLLILQLPSINSDGTNIPGALDFVIYLLDPADPEQLQEITVSNSLSDRAFDTKTLAKNLAALEVTYYDAAGTALTSSLENAVLIKVKVTTSKTLKNRTLSASFADQAKLRNK